MKRRLSVLTTTWNRGSYLERVWRGLTAQTSSDFEWIVADDGSTDDTAVIVENLAARSSFPVIYLRAGAHVGKVRMDNEAIARASGELTLWCDSDDLLLPKAIERILAAWRSIEHRDQFVGISALASTAEGVIVNPCGDAVVDFSWNDLEVRFTGNSDMVYVARTEALKAHPFPEVDLVVPESVVWNVIGNQLARFIPEVLKHVEYRTPNAISFSGVMNYNRGRAHALASCHRELCVKRPLMPSRFRSLVTYLRYCWHGDIGLRDGWTLWDHGSRLRFAVALPVAGLLVIHDAFRNKVVKSHREFLKNQGAAVTVRYFAPARPAMAVAD